MIDDNYKYNSVTVALYIVAVMNNMKLEVNMTKLQKLLYIAYGTYLAIKNCRLTNEHPQAWPYGPVFPTTRNKLLKKDLSVINISIPELADIRNDIEMQQLVMLVLNGFGRKNATTLSVWSHQSGSPWDRVVSQAGFTWGERIPDEYIQEYFKSILEKDGK